MRKLASKAQPQAKFYLNAARLRANGACPGAIAGLTDVLGQGNWPVNDASYNKLKAAGLEWRITWIGSRYLNREELNAAHRSMNRGGANRPDAMWRAIKRKMKRDNKRRPKSWY